MLIIDDQKFKEYVEKAPDCKTTIHFWDLYPGHYTKLKKEFQKQFFKESIKKGGNYYTNLSKKLGISRRTIAECSKCKTNPQISIILRIAKFLNFPLEEIEKNILEVSNLKPKFPFNLHSPEGAEIRAAFLSDGHLPARPIKPPTYMAFEIELHKRLVRLCKRVFGDFDAQTKFSGKTHVTLFPAVIGTALELAGVPRKDKRLVKTFVPKDILLGQRRIQASYLRRVFDDEGDVCFDKHGKRAVRITRSTDITNQNLNTASLKSEKWTFIKKLNVPISHLLYGEQLLLCKLGIDARVYSEGLYKSLNNRITAKWRIQIGQQSSLRKFAELINFNLKEKQEKLSKMLKSYKREKFPNGEGEKFSIRVLKSIYSRKGYIMFGDLAKELIKTGRSYDLAGWYLKILIEKKVIQKIKRGKYVFIN